MLLCLGSPLAAQQTESSDAYSVNFSQDELRFLIGKAVAAGGVVLQKGYGWDDQGDIYEAHILVIVIRFPSGSILVIVLTRRPQPPTYPQLRSLPPWKPSGIVGYDPTVTNP